MDRGRPRQGDRGPRRPTGERRARQHPAGRRYSRRGLRQISLRRQPCAAAAWPRARNAHDRARQGKRCVCEPMSLLKLLAAPFRYRPWRPRHARLIVRDLVGKGAQPEHPHVDHLRAAIDWLCWRRTCATTSPTRRVSAGWSFEDGWLPSYPKQAGISSRRSLRQPGARSSRSHRARSAHHRLGAFDPATRWCVSRALRRAGQPARVFNTGQIMHGCWRAICNCAGRSVWKPRSSRALARAGAGSGRLLATVRA